MVGDVYFRLREFLDTLPSGFPETPSGVEIKLLQKMFTPAQAELTLQLSPKPETVTQIARRTGLEETTLAAQLEALARNGLIFRQREKDQRYYHAHQVLVGIFEFQLKRMDQAYAELFEEYIPYLIRSFAPIKTSQLRIVPVASAIEAKSQVAPYDRIRETIQNATRLAVAPCHCRIELRLMGRTCTHPDETCLMLDKFARYYIDNDFARPISSTEALQILDVAEENGLIIRPINSQKPQAICCCCTCGCLKRVAALPNPGEIIGSSFKSVIDPEACVGCGDCMEICPLQAIEDQDGRCAVNAKRCVGCGLCVKRCPVEAIAMIAWKENEDVPPRTWDDLLAQIAAERGM